MSLGLYNVALLEPQRLRLSRYDDLKSAQDNIDLQSTILSRFDLIFIVKDERTMETDKQIARCGPSMSCRCLLMPALQSVTAKMLLTHQQDAPHPAASLATS